MLNVPKHSRTPRGRLGLRIAILITAALSTLAAACGGDSTAPSTRFDGVYGLSTVNGQPLPFTFDSTASSKTQLVSATITVVTGAGGTTLFETEEDQTSFPGQPTVTNASSDTATVAVDTDGQFGNALFSGSFTTGGLTLLAGGAAYVFQKAAVDPP